MNYIDFIIIISVIIGTIHGAFKGLVYELASLIALIFGVWGAVKFSGAMEIYLLHRWGLNHSHIQTISFMVTFFLIVFVVHLIGQLLHSIITASSLGSINQLLGAFFGFLRAVFILGVIIILVERMHESSSIVPRHDIEQSKLYQPLASASLIAVPFLKDLYDDMITPTQNHEKESGKSSH